MATINYVQYVKWRNYTAVLSHPSSAPNKTGCLWLEATREILRELSFDSSQEALWPTPLTQNYLPN